MLSTVITCLSLACVPSHSKLWNPGPSVRSAEAVVTRDFGHVRFVGCSRQQRVTLCAFTDKAGWASCTNGPRQVVWVDYNVAVYPDMRTRLLSRVIAGLDFSC